MSRFQVPLFPLRTVLFPDGPLPLRVFETRYLDMVSSCMKQDQPFGVILLAEESSEDGEFQSHTVGTLAKIVDWYQGSDGILGITAEGGERFQLYGVTRQEDGLWIGDVETVAREPAVHLPGEFRPLAELLRIILDDLGKLYENVQRRFDDATWVGYRLAEVLPMELQVKQHCLELADPLERLELVRPLLKTVRTEQAQ